jgi:drug/metabolite transporter (DMT)-like permease
LLPSHFTPRLIGVVLIGLVAVSFASILIRWCEAPALSIAFYRLLFASLFFALFAGKPAVREWRALPRAALRMGVLSGIALAAHFATWITALFYTSVASSTVLVSTAPIFVALGTRFILREPSRPALFAGIIVAVIGTVIITATDAGDGHNSWRGDLLALGGAIAGSVYLLTGRHLRRQLGTPAYVVMSYSVDALTALLSALVLQDATGGILRTGFRHVPAHRPGSPSDRSYELQLGAEVSFRAGGFGAAVGRADWREHSGVFAAG